MGPLLNSVGLGWVDFHVMRRTHPTLMNEMHDDPKLVADQLGHTLDVKRECLYARLAHKAKTGGRCTGSGSTIKSVFYRRGSVPSLRMSM